jgi:hypothetical protein
MMKNSVTAHVPPSAGFSSENKTKNGREGGSVSILTLLPHKHNQHKLDERERKKIRETERNLLSTFNNQKKQSYKAAALYHRAPGWRDVFTHL